MKIINFITTFLFLLNFSVAYCQITEIKGNNNSYVLEESKNVYEVYNKNSTLMHTTPSYLLYEHTPPVTVGNKAELDGIVNYHFSPVFKKYTGSFNELSYLLISLFSDINGDIKELYISYTKEVGVIPATVIEDFEKAVLQSNVKLEFDNNLHEFQGTSWVAQYSIYDPVKIRHCE